MNRVRTLISVVLALLAVPAWPGSVEVSVRDRAGRTVSDRHVSLHPQTPLDQRALHAAQRLRGLTDRDGRVIFDNVGEGRYGVYAQSGDGLLAPQDNPFLPPPIVSIVADDDRQRIDLELWPATPVRVHIEVPSLANAWLFSAVFAHRESGKIIVDSFRKSIYSRERLLAPGIWSVSVEPQAGYLLIGVEQGRIDIDGSAVTLDLTLFPTGTDLTFSYSGLGTLYGAVAETNGKEPTVEIQASLLEAGAWLDEARRRGGSVYQQVSANVDGDTGFFEMELPDGDWSVRPSGALLVASSPESMKVTIPSGGVGRADFTITLEEEAGTELAVKVVNEDGAGIDQALVVAYFVGREDEGPVSSAISTMFGTARLEAVPAGDITLAAGHPEYLEGKTEIAEYDPDEMEERFRFIELSTGSELFFEALDSEDRPIAGVELEVARLGEAPPTLIDDDGLDAARAVRLATSDHSGRAHLGGFYAGEYRARATRRGTAGSTSLIHVREANGRLDAEIELEIGSEEKITIEGREVPSGTVYADLGCADSWPLPDAAAVRVVEGSGPLPTDRSGRSEPQQGLVWSRDDLVLRGRHRDRVEAGPLPAGVYRLALRPAGFDRWTWAYETNDPLRSTEIVVDQTSATGSRRIDLELIEIECGPAIDLLVRIAGVEPFPDFEGIEVFSAKLLDPRRDEEVASPPWSAAEKDRIELRGLPATEIRLDLVLEHPHFLPQSMLAWQIPLELQRGKLVEPIVDIEGLGGAIELKGLPREGIEAVVGLEGEIPKAVAINGSGVLLPSLQPGSYDVRVHDRDGNILLGWSDVRVEAGITIELESTTATRGASHVQLRRQSRAVGDVLSDPVQLTRRTEGKRSRCQRERSEADLEGVEGGLFGDHLPLQSADSCRRWSLPKTAEEPLELKGITECLAFDPAVIPVADPALDPKLARDSPTEPAERYALDTPCNPERHASNRFVEFLHCGHSTLAKERSCDRC